MTAPRQFDASGRLTVAITPAVLYGGTMRKARGPSSAAVAGGRACDDDLPARFDELLDALDQLNATPRQLDGIVAVIRQAMPQLQSLASRLSQNGLALRSIAPTDPAYAALARDARAYELERVRLAGELRTRIDAVLTPAQRARVPAVLAADLADRFASRRRPRGAEAHVTSRHRPIRT